MQTITVICTPPNVVIRSGDLRLTRAMSNAFAVTLADSAGSALDLSGVAAWELGVTKGFRGSTPLLAATNAITTADNVLTIALNGHTVEMAEYLDGKKTAQGFATLKGYNGAGDTVAAYVWPVTLQNVGFDADTEAAHAVDGLFYTAAQVDAKFAAIGDAIPAATESSRGTIALATAEEAAAGDDAGKAVTPATLKPMVDAKENVANKTQEIDAVTPSADKYTSEAAVVAYVEGAVTDALGDIDAALDELIGGTP